MTQAERRRLAALLAALDAPARPAGQLLSDPATSRRRRLALRLLLACCVILAGWIVVLAATLPHHFNAQHWRALWVGFDVLELAAFAATAWATWRRRQILILLLAVTGTMLCCDAWFDVGTALGTGGMWFSIADAAFAELPLAVLFLTGARRLLKATIRATRLAGDPVAGERDAGGSPSLRRTPLSGDGLHEALPRRRGPGLAGR